MNNILNFIAKPFVRFLSVIFSLALVIIFMFLLEPNGVYLLFSDLKAFFILLGLTLVVFSLFLFFSGFLFGDTLFWAFLRSVQILIFTCCVVFVVAFVVSKPYFPSGNITLDTVEPVSVSTYLSETGNLTEIPEDASKPYDLLMKALPISDNLKDVTFVKAELDGTALETSHALIDFLPYSTIGDDLGLVGLRTSSEPNTVYLVLNQTDCSEEEITVDVLHFLKSSGFLQPYSTPFMCWVLVFLVVVLYLLDLGLCFVWLNNL